MGKLKVDYIIGKRPKEMSGLYRYANEIIDNNKATVDGLFIDYGVDIPLPVIGKLPALLYYPFVVASKRREGSIKHLCSHIQAHLLNYLRLQPSIVTCFDIFPFLQDEYPFIDKRIVSLGIKGMLKADAIITISNFSKAEISKALDYPAEKIRAIHLGVDHHRYKPFHGHQGVRHKYRLPVGKEMILYVGTEQPRKNLPTLIKAFAEVKKDRKDIVFLKVGRPQWRNARRDLLALIERLDIQNDVIFVDYVPEEDLPAIYNNADLFVFPSIYEGFGLPPLEAMACACPVITSNAASLPEVVGEAGLMVEPYDVIGLADAMREVLTNQERREEMIAKGLEQAARFNWKRTAEETERIYREVLGYM